MRIYLLAIVFLLGCCTSNTKNTESATTKGFRPLFNGKDLDGWTPKIRGHNFGDNFANTFRVEDGMIKVRYDGYKDFAEQFGHLFYKSPFSNYHLVLEYRFVDKWMHDTPGWAYRNSGIMFHCQDPKTMMLNQDFPISIEYQLLGGLDDGEARSTGNLCTPGTDVFINGKIEKSHCLNSSSKTYEGDQWVRAELIVYNDSLVQHIINGDTVMQYSKPRIFGGNVDDFDPKVKIDGTPLKSGYISLQSEGSPVDFRKVEIKELKKRLITEKGKEIY